MGYREGRRGDRALCLVEVLRRERVSPNFVRVTVGGDALDALDPRGFDHWFRLFLPRGADTDWNLPRRMDRAGYQEYLAMPEATRPILRNYTVREFRPDARELDIDFVVHGTEGPASRFALTAEPGDRVALLDQGIGWEPVGDSDWTLIVGDETALPAVAGILRDLPPDARGVAAIEVPDAADVPAPRDLPAPAGVSVHRLVREHGTRPGALALATVPELPLPEGTPSVFLAGEQAMATGLRRWLVKRGVPRRNIVFTGYWRVAKSADEH